MRPDEILPPCPHEGCDANYHHWHWLEDGHVGDKGDASPERLVERHLKFLNGDTCDEDLPYATRCYSAHAPNVSESPTGSPVDPTPVAARAGGFRDKLAGAAIPIMQRVKTVMLGEDLMPLARDIVDRMLPLSVSMADALTGELDELRPAWDRPEVEAVVDRDGAVWSHARGRCWRVVDWDTNSADFVERVYGPCVPLARVRPTITQAERAESLARAADAAYAEGVSASKADPYAQGYQGGWTEAWSAGAHLDEAEYRRGYEDAKAEDATLSRANLAYLDAFTEGFSAGWRSAEATRAAVSPAAPDLDPSAPPATRGPQRKPWLTGAQADAAIRERRGLSGACDRLMRGFTEGDR